MKKKTATLLTLALAGSVSACGGDVTSSDEYQALEQEVAALEQQVSDLSAESAPVSSAVPAEVVAVLDEWWAANERADGSVADLYLPTGYHMYGTRKIELGGVAAHLGNGSFTPEWITEPYLIADEPEGRYVVTRGLRNSLGDNSAASALTFEILTMDGELKIAETGWTHVHE